MRWRWWSVLFNICLLLIAWKVSRRVVKTSKSLSWIPGWVALRVPLLRVISVKDNLARAARLLERLLAAGVPLDAALDRHVTDPGNRRQALGDERIGHIRELAQGPRI